MFRLAATDAQDSHSLPEQAQALLLTSGCQIRLYHYGAALKTLDSAKQVALHIHDSTLLGAIATNVSSIYFVLGDISLAARTAEESVHFLHDSLRRDYLARALAVYGDIQFGLGMHLQGNASLTQAIEIAKAANLPAVEALAENHLAAWLILSNDLDNAEKLLQRALVVSTQAKDGFELAETSEHLGELEGQRGGSQLRSALAHIDAALSTSNEQFRTEPQYYPLHIRGQILLSLGEKAQALAELRRAVASADMWRQSALPGDATNTRTVAELDSVYKDYAQLAADLSLERADPALARDAFDVLARNRAAGFREQLTRSYSSKLLDSPEYFDVLQQLQAAQAAATLENDTLKLGIERRKLDQIRARLSDLQNRIGFTDENSNLISEKKPQQESLRGIQARLSDSEALLSFSLGGRKSFLWAITREDFKLYVLPEEAVIAREAGAFSSAVSSHAAGQLEAGRALSQSLFATLAPSFKRKLNWIIAPDGALLDKVPFAAIPAFPDTNGRPLMADHSLRISAGVWSARTGQGKKTGGGFIGIADPIYNKVDIRADRTSPRLIASKQNRSIGILSRLVASEKEIRVSAEQSGLTQTKMLLGRSATGLDLRQAIQRSPDILHFAVHVISPKDFPREAALALSLGPDNLPELLTAESVATYRVPGSLVVLSGCTSQQGDILPGAGIIGLSRGWLLAGAAAVIVSAWPTPDESGRFFAGFYAHFRQLPGTTARRAAAALQLSQLDMQRSGSDLSEPKFWAAYSVISKE